MNDPIADMLSRIRNAILSGKNDVNVPYSKLKSEIAKILAGSGFLSSVTTEKSDGFKRLKIVINDPASTASITEVNRISSPGRRQYVNAKEIPRVKSGRGIVVVSTSQGVMDGAQAKQKGLGGELICEVY